MKNFPRVACTSLTLLLILLYLKFAADQYTEFFYESQFLHIGFINDLVRGVFNAKNFFTIYAEHLFPGYNILLFINYKLFGITSLFELGCSVFASISMACLLSMAAMKNKRNWWLPIVIFAIVLSPIQNIMWGMAFAAHISTLFLVLIMYLIYFGNSSTIKLVSISVLIPLYVVFFAGAYSIGFVAAIASICVLADFKEDKKLLMVLIGASTIAYAVYYILLEIYGAGISSANGYHYNVLSIADFADLMLGSSLLGKAFFEKYPDLTIYYIAGFYVFCMLLIVGWKTIPKRKKLQKSDKYFIALCVYAMANVLVVSITRNTNGSEGALGQWYQAHLKFIPVAIVYFLSSNNVESRAHTIINKCLVIILVVFLALGYSREYIKGPYVKAWKNNITATIPEHLIHSDRFLSSTSPEPLSWDAGTVLEGISILYKNNLSYFAHTDSIYSNGFTQDRWVEKTTDKFFDVICPYQTKKLTIQLDRMNKDNLQFFPRKLNVTNNNGIYQITYYFPNEIKIFRLSLSDFLPYNSTNSMDLRKLLFHIAQIQCKLI